MIASTGTAAFARLVYWLGPWAEHERPSHIHREARQQALAGGRTMTTYEYAPTAGPLGVYVVVPGLHPDGPDDPRLDRFCRILAATGFLVVAPCLPDHLALRVRPTAVDDLAIAVDLACARAKRLALPRPALFSISFGSSPAIGVAAQPTRRDALSGLVLFGGYADFERTVRFAITGEPGRVKPDPLNPPAVFVNVLPYLDVPDDDARLLETAWLTMVQRTWGKMELKAEGALVPFGDAIARTLPEHLRELFLLGCGLRAGGLALVDRALTRGRAAFAHADPRAQLAHVHAPVVVVHGRTDDVIPWTEAPRLFESLPPAHPGRLLITGLYGHTGVALPSPGELAREAKTMLDVARAMIDAPLGLL